MPIQVVITKNAAGEKECPYPHKTFLHWSTVNNRDELSGRDRRHLEWVRWCPACGEKMRYYGVAE